MSDPKKIDFSLRIRTATNTAEGALLDYIDSGEHPPYSSKEMVMKGLCAYYMVFAYCQGHHTQPIKSAVKRQLGRECITSLKQQTKEIEEYCGLEASESALDASDFLSQLISEAYKKIDFSLRIRTATNTAEGALLDYIDSGKHPPYSSKEMLLRALNGYYMAFAYCQSNYPEPVSSTVKKQLGRECIASLKRQIKEIGEYCGLEASEPASSASNISLEIISRLAAQMNDSLRSQPVVSSSNNNGVASTKDWISDDCF